MLFLAMKELLREVDDLRLLWLLHAGPSFVAFLSNAGSRCICLFAIMI